MTMTFQQFQKSKQAVADLGDFFGDECLKGASGFVYLDQLWIEETTSWPVSKRVDGRYYTLIGRREYQSDFIQDCEEPLYQFAVEEILTEPTELSSSIPWPEEVRVSEHDYPEEDED